MAPTVCSMSAWAAAVHAEVADGTHACRYVGLTESRITPEHRERPIRIGELVNERSRLRIYSDNQHTAVIDQAKGMIAPQRG